MLDSCRDVAINTDSVAGPMPPRRGNSCNHNLTLQDEDLLNVGTCSLNSTTGNESALSMVMNLLTGA